MKLDSECEIMEDAFLQPLSRCTTLRTITLTRVFGVDRSRFGVACARILSQLPQLREIVSEDGALEISTITHLAASASLRRLTIKPHDRYKRSLEELKQEWQYLLQLHALKPDLLITCNDKFVMVDLESKEKCVIM